MAKKTLKGLPNSQILFKEHWHLYNSGSKWLEYVEDKRGEKIVETIQLDDIKPNQKYYFQQVTNKQHFYPTIFHPSVSWSTIQELHKTGRIWQLTQEKKDTATSSTLEIGSEI